MPNFSSADCNSLIRDFWNADRLRCPEDNTILFTHYFPCDAGYLLVIACPFCRRKVQITPFSDPLRGHFRRWTASEIESLLNADAAGCNLSCPICQAQVRADSTLDGTHVFHCPRCGNIKREPLFDMA